MGWRTRLGTKAQPGPGVRKIRMVDMLGNCSSSGPFQGFSSPSYLGSATPIIQNKGFHDLNISAQSYVWLPDSTECCLTFCTNKTTATR